MAEKFTPHVRLHLHAEHMAPGIDKILKARPEKIGGDQRPHHTEKRRVSVLRQQVLHRVTGGHREKQVHRRDHERTEHVRRE